MSVGDQRLLQKTLRDFLARACPVERLRALWDSETGRSAELWQQLAEVGVPGQLVPEAEGGLGMDEIDQVLLLEETDFPCKVHESRRHPAWPSTPRSAA